MLHSAFQKIKIPAIKIMEPNAMLKQAQQFVNPMLVNLIYVILKMDLHVSTIILDGI
jgi:hypothetical protein